MNTDIVIKVKCSNPECQKEIISVNTDVLEEKLRTGRFFCAQCVLNNKLDGFKK